MFVDDSKNVTGSRERSRPRGAEPAHGARWVAGGRAEAGRGLFPALLWTVQGFVLYGKGASAMSMLSFASTSLPGRVRLPRICARLRCLRSQVLSRRGEARARGAAQAGKVWGFPGSLPNPFPWLGVPGSGPRWSQGAGSGGKGCSRAKDVSPRSRVLTEALAGLSRSRSCLRAVFPFARAVAARCFWPGTSWCLERKLRSSCGRKTASQK